MTIKIFETTIGSIQVNAVNARELYNILEVKSAFKDWIHRRLNDTQAERNFDYVMYKEKNEENADKMDFSSISSENANEILDKEYSKGRPSNEYIITLNLAKEFAMLEKNKNGKKIRKYFIEFQKMGIVTIAQLRKEIKVLHLNISDLENELNNVKKLLYDSQKIMDKYSKIIEAKGIQSQIDSLIKRRDELRAEGYSC